MLAPQTSTTLACRSGDSLAQKVALISALVHEPDLIILDMNMPGLGGAGTLPEIRRLLPEVPVLLATGRSNQGAEDLVASQPGVTLLAKPFTLEELRRQLNPATRG